MVRKKVPLTMQVLVKPDASLNGWNSLDVAQEAMRLAAQKGTRTMQVPRAQRLR